MTKTSSKIIFKGISLPLPKLAASTNVIFFEELCCGAYWLILKIRISH